MFCKSGILIFIYAENNYLIYAHTLLIKTFAPSELGSPCLSFFLSILSVFLSLSLSLFLANSLELGGPLSSLSCPGF